MSEPEQLTDEQKIVASIGPIWEPDPSIKSWTVNGPNGPVEMTHQWTVQGFRWSTPLPDGSGLATAAVKDAREA